MSDKFLNPTPGSGADLALQSADSPATASANRSLVTEFLDSAKYAGVQSPAQGFTQLIDRALGTNLMQKVTFMEAPLEAASTDGWHAQQLGSATGIAGDFFVVNRLFKLGSKTLGGAAQSEMTALSFNQAVTHSAKIGAIYQGLFTPTSPDESLAGGRFKSALHGAVTFGSLTGSARGLQELGLLKNRIAIGTAAGIPAGAISAQTDSLLHGRGFASFKDTAQSAYNFAWTGGLLSAAHEIPLSNRPKSAIDSPSENNRNTGADTQSPAIYRVTNESGLQALQAFRRGETQTAWAEVKRGNDPKRTLFVQHEGTPHAMAQRADILAMCNLPEASPLAGRLAVPGATGRPMFMDMLSGDLVRFASERISPEAVQLKQSLSPEMVKILEHNLSKMHLEGEQVNKMRQALDSNEVQLTMMDRTFMEKNHMFSREMNQTRPETQKELGNAGKYDPLKATQPVIVVKFDVNGKSQYHVINGNNRVHLFGSEVTNAQNKALPVMLFNKPEALVDVLNVDPYTGFPFARRFNFF